METPEEPKLPSLQKIKEEQVIAPSPKNYQLPKLPITDEDRDEFARCLHSGRPFHTKFDAAPPFGISITLRDKTKREGDIISRQMDYAFNEKKILSIDEYSHLYNLGCLYYQLEEMNGVRQNRACPLNQWDMKSFDLLGEIDRSPIGEMTSTQIYIMISMMTQFNEKLFNLAKEVVGSPENFSNPVKDS